MRFILVLTLLAGVCLGADRERVIIAHYMGCFPLGRLAMRHWLEKSPELTRHDARDAKQAAGGAYRNWPLRPRDFHPTPAESADLEIRRAMRIGLDGFAIDAWAGHKAKDVLDAFFAVAEEKDYPFVLTICLDPNCHGDYTRGDDPPGLVQGYTDTLNWLMENHGDSPKLARRDGKPLILGYHSRGHHWGFGPDDWWGEPDKWSAIPAAYEEIERRTGRDFYFHFCVGSFFHGTDLHELPGARPPHQPGPWIVKASEYLAGHFPAIGAFLDKDIYPELDEIAAVVQAQGAEWSQPLWHQYERVASRILVEPGTDKLRDRWERARRTGSTLLQYVTWNDYGEATNIAPDYHTRYAIYDLNGYFIEWWKTGTQPSVGRDRVYLIYRQYPADRTTFPFRSMHAVPGVLEVLTLLPEPATVVLPGRDVRYEAPAGLHTAQFPLVPGSVSAELHRGGHRVLRLDSPEPITDKPFRDSNAMVAFSTEFERHWRLDFPDTQPFYTSEYGDADGDGLPNWFEMYWFGTFLDWSTTTTADPTADPDGDGQDNLAEYRAQTDPTKPPASYAPGNVWDIGIVPIRRISFNPDPDEQGTPVWHYLYRLGPGPVPHGDYQPCPHSGLTSPYAGNLVHGSPYRDPELSNVHGWISRDAVGEGARLQLRPRTQALLAIGWRSPIAGTVRLDGNVADVRDRDGITLTIETAAGEHYRQVWQPDDTGAFTSGPITVAPGDHIYLVADSLPGRDYGPVLLDGLCVTWLE